MPALERSADRAPRHSVERHCSTFEIRYSTDFLVTE
jgi:hypothetical protein